MIRENITVGGPVGLHARPAAEFVKIAERFKSKVKLAKDGIWVNGRSILAILSLAAERGSVVTLEVQGEDEEQAFQALKEKLTENDA